MRRQRTADRLLDGIVIVLVTGVLALAATSPRAADESAWGEVTVVDSPSPARCTTSDVAQRQACLATAVAIALTR